MKPLLALLLAFTLHARAGDKIWSAVLLASNAANPKPAPAELKPIAKRLQRVFGYNQFEIVGHDAEEVGVGDARFSLTPTKTFWLHLQARHATNPDARGGYLLNLLLYQNDRPLVDTVALVAPGSPLFFRGPMSAHGQVLVVLQVQP